MTFPLSVKGDQRDRYTGLFSSFRVLHMLPCADNEQYSLENIAHIGRSRQF